MSVVSGLHEFVFSAHVSERERLLRFWAGLGFQPDAEGALSAADAEALGKAVGIKLLEMAGGRDFLA